MNDVARKAVEQALANASDDLARAKMQEKADPTWVSGNDEPIGTVVASYQHRVNELREALGFRDHG